MAAFLTIGLFTDIIAKGSHLYTCIMLLHGLSFLLLAINIIYTAASGHNLFGKNDCTFLVFGYLSSCGWVLIYIIVPLYITAKQREKRAYFEIPMAA